MKKLKISHIGAPLLVGIMVFLMTMVILAPKLREIASLNQQNSNLKTTLGKLTLKLASLESLDQTSIEQQVQKIQEFLPAQKDIPQALIISRSLADQAGLVIKKMTIDNLQTATSTAKKKEPTLIYSYAIVTTAQIPSDRVLPFLQRVETASPLLSLDKLSLTTKTGTDYEISYNLNHYYLEYPGQIGSLESVLPQIKPDEAAAYEKVLTYYQPLLTPEISTGGAELEVPFGKNNPFTP